MLCDSSEEVVECGRIGVDVGGKEVIEFRLSREYNVDGMVICPSAGRREEWSWWRWCR